MTQQQITEYIDQILNAPVYSKISIEEKEDLRNLLVKYLTDLYVNKTETLVNALEQLVNFNAVMHILALGYGIEEEDIDYIAKIIFMKINEYFYKKGSLEVLRQLREVLNVYLIDVKMYELVYFKDCNCYRLRDVVDV